jgi:ribosomal protein L7Ae-like RNA K-turn-binding protein
MIEQEQEEDLFNSICNYVEKQMSQQMASRTADRAHYSYRMRKASRIPPPSNHILCGVNAVTRGLEKEQVKLVLIFKNEVDASILIQHLPMMAKIKKATLGVFSIGSLRLRRLLHLNTLAAIAFTRQQPNQQEFDELMTKIATNLPDYSIPWMEEGLLGRSVPGWAATYLPARLKVLETTMPMRTKRNGKRVRPSNTTVSDTSLS